jgi:branched-chain amino acid aminotransferase
MFMSCKILGIKMPFTRSEIEEAIVEVLRVNGIREDAYIRPIAFVSSNTIALDIRGLEVSVAIFAFPFGKYLPEAGVRAKIVSWRRVHNSMMPVYAKIGGVYVNSVLAITEATSGGFDEAILLDKDGYVVEGSGENIFIVKNGRLHTPPTYDSILEGITRNTVIELARDLGIDVVERRIAREELYSSDEAFFTGTAAEVTPIVEVDGRVIGSGEPGPVTRRIRGYYLDVVRGRVGKYRHWLKPVY